MCILKRYKVCFVVLCAGLMLIMAGCDKNQQQGQASLPEVTFMVVEPRRVELTTELSGRTSALEVAEVRPQVTGIIQKRLFVEGDEVVEGQQLYQIDPALYEAALAEAKASLLRAQANLTAAQLLANRSAQAVKVNAVSKQENDNAVASMNQARAEVAATKAAVDTATINMHYTKVNAPISGHIGISAVTPGALCTANQAQALATIQHLDQMYVDVTQSSAEILRLKHSLLEGRLTPAEDGGAKVTLVLEDGWDYGIVGTLQLADITVDTGTGAITVRAKFDNPLKEISPGRKERLLFPGMFVRAVLQEAVDENAVMVPQMAVGRDTMGRPTVYCLNADDTIREEVVELERSIGSEYLVRSGLKPGEKLVIDGRVKVRPGAKVKAIPHAEANERKGGGAEADGAVNKAEASPAGGSADAAAAK